MNILFTSVGRRVELLRAFRQAYQSLELDGKIVAIDKDPLAPALRLADRPAIVPTLSSPKYIPTLIDICRREQVRLVFPLIDPDITALARHRVAIEASGARLAVISTQAVATTTDKWLTFHFLHRLGITTPCSWLPGQLDPAQAEYPLFIKPRCGSAATHAFKVNDAQELAFFSEYVPHAIIQEYLPGPEITNDIICDLEGEVLAVVSRQRIEIRWGEVAKGVTIHDSRITDTCIRIAQALHAVGPITIQCILKDGIPHFTEINARFGGGAPLGIAAGVDAPRWLLARAAGLPVVIPSVGTYQTGLYMTRFDDSFFLTEAEYEHVAGHRL